ncbi:hypothetical protein E24_00323 [Faustovirus]|nr:hypothetical protein PRJ_Fausto_00305 [Faustovirus]AMN83243.1 hypothetical protein E24_00323 [Faustovirus]AMN84224.1 hypothetical protein D5a_00320 [Faustovirus]AMN85212.1 hypothetical protein E23_00322 [Faustovirus]QBR99213.1 hypothetical protein [Faustovirus mariensis]
MDFELKKHTHLFKILSYTPLQAIYIDVSVRLRNKAALAGSSEERWQAYMHMMNNLECLIMKYYNADLTDLFVDLLDIFNTLFIHRECKKRIMRNFNREQTLALAKRYPTIGNDVMYQATITRHMDIIMELKEAGVALQKIEFKELHGACDIIYSFLDISKTTLYGHEYKYGHTDSPTPTLKLSYEYSAASGMKSKITSVFDEQNCKFMEFLNTNNLLVYDDDTYGSGFTQFEGRDNKYSQLDPCDDTTFIRYALESVSQPLTYSNIGHTSDDDAFISFAPSDFALNDVALKSI